MSENVSPVPSAPPGSSVGVGAVVVVGVAIVAVGGIALGTRVGDNDFVQQHWWLAALSIVGLVDAAAGSALLARHAHRRLAWCLLVSGVAAVLAVVLATSGYTEAVGRAPGWDEIGNTESWARPLATGVLVALVPWELATTDGRSRWELAWWTTAALVVASVVGEALGARSPGLDVVDVATWLVAASATAATALVVAGWWRARGSSDDTLLGWIAAGTVVAWLAVVPERIGAGGFGLPSGHVIGSLLLITTVPLLVVGVVVRALREQPGRIQGVAPDVIAWLVLTGAIVAVYTVVVAGVGRLVGGNGSTALLVATTVTIALLVEPTRRRARMAVDRLVWGLRDDPLTVVRGVVDHVGADADGELLPALVQSLSDELRLDFVAIDVRVHEDWRRAAAFGTPSTHHREVPLTQREDVVGRLVVGWDDGHHLRARDERVLAELAGPLALAVGWVRLTSELRHSSVSLASAREEERRRLRRDLHDGLGPALTGVSLGLRSTIQRLERSTEQDSLDASRELLERTADEVDSVVDEVKRIVRDLRPGALDQLGLTGALLAFTRTLGAEVEFHSDLPAASVDLPAPVEVAAYRIVTEAVTNVVRHADAGHCWLTISVDGPQVRIDVADDGVGCAPESEPGVGLTAMHERATALGGTVAVSGREPNGTLVRARIPLDVS